MKIDRILIASPMYKELESIMKKKEIYKEKEFRFRSEEDVKEEDYDWADSFVAFVRPSNFKFGNIKWVHSLGAGVDKLIKNIDWKESVLLTRTIGPFGQKISEYCLSYLLQEFQNHDQYEQLQKKKKWEFVAPTPLMSRKVVIYGTGAIGQEVAKTLSFFGIQVYGVSLSGTHKPQFTKVVSSEEKMEEISDGVDAVINTMPLTERTFHFFNEKLLGQFQQVIFINVGRGESVHNDALLDAIHRGNIKRAILDVFHVEPLPKDSPLWVNPNIRITPHISAVTTPEEGIEYFLQTLKHISSGKHIKNSVDIQKGF